MGCIPVKILFQVWKHLVEPPAQGPRINVYMAVPTIYAKLIEHYDKMFSAGISYSRTKEFVRATCVQKLRCIKLLSSVRHPLLYSQ